jgi:MFS transporter, putative metabolite:H+ symporter
LLRVTFAPQAPTSSVAARLDRLPVIRTHWLVVVIVGLGLFFDGYDNFLAGAIAVVLRKELLLNQTQLSWLLGSAFLGQFLGAVLMGRLADRVGRRKAFLINLALFSVFTLAGGFSPNATILVVTRFVAGVGIGAETVLADVYLSEFLPRNVRGRLIAWAYTLSFLGVPVVGLLARWLVPVSIGGVEGWRIVFILGAVGACAVWVVRRRLPESPRWLALTGRHREAEDIVAAMEDEARAGGRTLVEPDPTIETAKPARLSVAALFRAPFTRRTTLLWLMSALGSFGYYGFGVLVPLVLAGKGFGIVQSLGFVATIYVGYPLGSALSVPLMERIERKHLVVACGLLIAAFGVLFGLTQSSVLIVVFGLAYTLVSNVYSNALHVYLAESYPTEVRAGAAGAAYSMSKLSTAALPFLLVPLLATSGPGAVFSVVAAALLVVSLAAMGSARTNGRSA